MTVILKSSFGRLQRSQLCNGWWISMNLLTDDSGSDCTIVTNQFRPIHLIYDNSWTVTIDGCHVLSMNYSPFRSNRLYPRVLTGSVFLIFKFIMCLFTLISVCLCLFYLLFFGHTSLFL